jgi:hypothetical protein
LQRFSIGYFKPAAQNSCQEPMNDYYSAWNNNSWILYSRPGYYSRDSSWFIAFIVNAVFFYHYNLKWSMRWLHLVVSIPGIHVTWMPSCNSFSYRISKVDDCCLAQSRSHYFRTPFDVCRNVPESAHRDVSPSTVCEPDVLDGKDCFELAKQILGALGDTSSGMLRDTVEQLFCFRQITRFSTAFSSRSVPDWSLFFLRLPVSGSSTLMECLNFYFRVIRPDAEAPQTQQIFIRSFSKFIFLSLGR